MLVLKTQKHTTSLKNIFLTLQAIAETSRISEKSIGIVRNVLKEKQIFGDVIGGPYLRVKKSFLDKLTIEQKEAIRSVVHDEMRKCLNKEEGARYPSVDSILGEVIKDPLKKKTLDLQTKNWE